MAGPEDVDIAVSAAKAAFTIGPWSTFTGAQRAACMHKFADLVLAHKEELPYLECVAMGRPIATFSSIDLINLAGCFRCE